MQKEPSMIHRLIAFSSLMMLATTTLTVWAQKHDAQSTTSTVGGLAVATGTLITSTEKPFEDLMADAMSVMHGGMHSALHTGDPDRDFVTMMIPHHQGAIDMAKAVLLYGKDPQMRRLAQEIITDQQSEIELMQLWLKRRDDVTPQSKQPSH
jgi:uncharacterized protein (DUF305 family)